VPDMRFRKNGAGKQIDVEKLTALAAVGLTQRECEAILDCSEDTIQRNFLKEYDLGKDKCCASVRRKQFELAMAGNPTMLIWLGKQLLQQREQHGISGPDGGAIPIANLTAADFTDGQLAALIAGK